MAMLEEAAARAAISKAMTDQIEALREERKRAMVAAKKNRVCCASPSFPSLSCVYVSALISCAAAGVVAAGGSESPV